MKQKLSFLFVLMLLPVVMISQEILSNHINLVDDLGRKQGEWKVFDSDGNLKYQGVFKNNEPVGEFTYYYPNGRVKAVINHLPGNDVAYASLYHPNGEKMAEGKYVDQKKDSTWVYYSDADGTVVSVETYVEQEKQGTWKTFYPNGQVAEEVTYVDGLEQGPWKQYFTGGEIKAKGQYENGKLEGLVQYFFLDGNVQISGTYENGKKDGIWMYFNEDMQTTKKEVYHDGLLVSSEEFFPEE